MSAFRRLLVPLDGSELAEWVLERTDSLLQAPDVQASLLGVVEGGIDGAELREAELRRELARLGGRFRASWTVRRGEPAEEIVKEVRERSLDLVMMCTHGRSGMARLLFGSVALQVLQASPVPVLLFRPLQTPSGRLSPVESHGAAAFRRVLVLLDGTAIAEEIVPGAAALASAGGGDLVLLTAVPGGADSADRARVAREYLENVRERVESRGIRVAVEVRTGSPAEEALQAAVERGADAVALTTHGRTGASRAKYGSVAERVLLRSNVPVLALRPARVAAEAAGRTT